MNWLRKLITCSQDEKDANAHSTDREKVIQSSVFHRRERVFIAATLLHLLATNRKRALPQPRPICNSCRRVSSDGDDHAPVISCVYPNTVTDGPVVITSLMF